MVWDQSRTAAVVRTVAKRTARMSEGSGLVGVAKSIANRVETVVRASHGYRWLTAEPDPSVVVIDLGETRTGSPLVWLLERAVEPADRAWTDSRLASVTIAVGAVLARSRTGQVLAVLLEPPDPAERE